MNAYQSTPPPRGATYTTDAHDERVETDPSRSLTMREIADLRWRYTQVESDLGIRSTFGAQLDAALAQRISDESMLDARRTKAMKRKLRKGWRPKRLATIVLLEHLGLVSAVRTELGDEYIYMHTPMRPVPADPYENDGVLWVVRKQREIDRRRRLVGPNHDRILEAVYGNSTLGDDVQSFRKRFGDLLDVVVAIVNSKRDAGDPPARSLVRAKLSDDSFVRMMKHGASGYLRAAAQAYAETRL